MAGLRKRNKAAQDERHLGSESHLKRMRLDVGSSPAEGLGPSLPGEDKASPNLISTALQEVEESCEHMQHGGDKPSPFTFSSSPPEVEGPVRPTVEAQKSRKLFLLDIFCGTAGVAAAFQALGGEALGLDHLIDKRRVKGPVAKIDLLTGEGQQTVEQWLMEGKVDCVMLAPPCGTSSRAREIPVPKRLRLRAGMQPQPLRSDAFPNGLPSLKGIAKVKVKAANQLYKFTRRVIELCISMQLPFICENPKRSLMWSTSPFCELPSQCHFQYIHACMYGSRRRKSSAFLMNFSAANLQSECDNNHTHLPWGLVDLQDGTKLQFSTSLETEYPSQLSKHLAIALLDALQAQGKFLSPANVQEDQLQRLGAGTQPRGIKSPIIMSEFKCKVEVTSRNVQVPLHIEDNVHFPFQGVPTNSKLIASRDVVQKGENGEKTILQKSTFGVFFSPWEFFHRTLSLEHPLDTPQMVESSNLRAICFIRDNSTADVKLFRTRQLKRFTARASDLAIQEDELHRSLDPDVARVLKGKRLLLFKEMALEAKVNDETLFEELTSGFGLTGRMPPSNQFPAKLKPATISVQQLRDSSIWARKAIHASCHRVGADVEIATAVYQETLQQLEDGWVTGPYTIEQLDERHAGCWVPSKRFGVKQGSKIRAVDDFSEFLINASVTATEKLQLFGIDEVVNTARTFLGCDILQVDEQFTTLNAPVDFGWFNGPWRRLSGRALDLKAAYKQLARSPSDSWASILAVWNPHSSSVEFFESVSLPFGSVCAVMSFNRMARALKLILSELFMLVNTNFFDDFCQLEVDGLCQSAWDTAELVMKLLGWRISLSDDKRLPFAGEFNMLGAVIDLTRSSQGIINVKNKESRLSDIGALVDSVCNSESITSSTLETLKGRLLYAAGYTFGRCTQLAIQLIARVTHRGPMVLLDERAKFVLKDAFRCLVESKPRSISAWSGKKPIIVFTDGACEEDGTRVTHGAVIYDPMTFEAYMFGDVVPERWPEEWRTGGKKQLICQAEIFPVIVAKWTWRHLLAGRSVLWFIDNNSALASVIRAYSPVLENFNLLRLNARLDVEIQCLNWYSRVPSKSNLSDDPSRLQFSMLEQYGFKRCTPIYDPHLNE